MVAKSHGWKKEGKPEEGIASESPIVDRRCRYIYSPAKPTDKSRSQTGFFIKNVFQKQRKRDGHREISKV